MAKVNVIRPKRLFAFAISFKPMIDGNELGVLKNGTTITTDLPVGKHVLSFKTLESESNYDITIEENTSEVNIIITPGIGFLTAQPALKDIEYK